VSALVSTAALASLLGQHNLCILDASWHMPSEKRNPRAEFEAIHLPGAIFFDIDEISDKNSSYPHMLPKPENFAASVCALGISNDDDIVIYDTNGLFSAARVWWMLRTFGHNHVKILDGGMPKWKAENLPIESGTNTLPQTSFQVHFQPDLLRTRQQVQDNISSKKELLLDARSSGRFGGSEPEPRPGLRSGHIEGSKNIFFKDVLSPPYNTLKPQDELRFLFENQYIDVQQPMVATCGSGVTACILALALYELGNDTVPAYDGAWAEWGSQPSR